MSLKQFMLSVSIGAAVIASGGAAASAEENSLIFTPRLWTAFTDQSYFTNDSLNLDSEETALMLFYGGSLTYRPASWDGVSVSLTALYGESDNDTYGVNTGNQISIGTRERERFDAEILVATPLNDAQTVRLFTGARLLYNEESSDGQFFNAGTNAYEGRFDADGEFINYLGEVGLGIVTPFDDTSPSAFFANGLVVGGDGSGEFTADIFDENGVLIATEVEDDNTLLVGADVNFGYAYSLDGVTLSGRYRLFILTDVETRNETNYFHGPEVNAAIRF